MAKKRRQHDEEAWRNAKKVCRLSARQVEMARALGMNPKKLPGLRPSPQQRWKLPVGEFIQERYWKRFGGNTWDDDSGEPIPGWRKPSTPREDAHAPAFAKGFGAASPGAVSDPRWQAQSLICYLTNVADDLERWLAHGTIDPEVQPQIGAGLREIADRLDTGTPVPEVPEIPLPPHETRAPSPRRDGHARTFDDDISF